MNQGMPLTPALTPLAERGRTAACLVTVLVQLCMVSQPRSLVPFTGRGTG